MQNTEFWKVNLQEKHYSQSSFPVIVLNTNARINIIVINVSQCLYGALGEMLEIKVFTVK